ncbi:cAMP-regulated D2 protein-like [Lingula anatina]|uniref:Carboxylic ester hydrolase n=1 Tax=Lingula anatina TaxID=7574 RepID=A0A1S3JRZ4_LINAN|nr:cAMP-regulated D2 protein-like [Lingula anatina]|eukprot:XP_013413087.1 cAMP-regulated D2 protein-like [Lingula anatina]
MQQTYLFFIFLALELVHSPSGARALRFVASSDVSKGQGPVVVTAQGPVQGIYRGSANIFYGIPYAEPPVGSLRWKPPVPKSPWGSTGRTLLGITLPPACPQVGCTWYTPPRGCINVTSEDCLFLNVFTPLNATNLAHLSVMVFIHGGQFTILSGASPNWDGEFMASQGNVVVVNFNYRLGALGFLVTGKQSDSAQGNYGIMDQRLAMTWVQKNIKNFGGNPDEVTLFGQSAGGQSVALHFTSEKSNALFKRAIVESAPFALPFKNYGAAKLLGDYLADALGCLREHMACLRNASADQVAWAAVKVAESVASLQLLELFEPWGPYVDGKEVLVQPIQAFLTGNYQRKPVMMGFTSEEAQGFVCDVWNRTLTVLEYKAVLLATFPEHAAEVFYMYPPLPTDDQKPRLVTLATDYLFGCATKAAVESISHSNSPGSEPVWLYVFNRTSSPAGWGNVTFCYWHVCHGAELTDRENKVLPGISHGYYTVILHCYISQHATNRTSYIQYI